MPKRIRPWLMFMTDPAADTGGGGQATTTPPAAAGTPGDPGTSTTDSDTGPAKTGDDEPLGEGGIKALQAERDARQQAEKDLAELRKEVEDSQKSAEQKAADDLKAARDQAAENSLKALKYEVAAEKEIPLKFASRLTGATKEELLADADQVKEFIRDATSQGPRPDPSQGKSGTPALPDTAPGVPRMAAAFEQHIESRT